jgi:hypothetical protein
MGSQLQPNHGLLIGAIVHLLKLIEMDTQEADEAGSFAVANKLWKVGTYICVLTLTSLCGHKGFCLDLAGLCKHIDKRRTGIIPMAIDKHTVLLEEVCRNLPHVTICFPGKFKGETGTDHHLITVANETSLGLCPLWWLERLWWKCVSWKGGSTAQRLRWLRQQTARWLPQQITMPCLGSTWASSRKRWISFLAITM